MAYLFQALVVLVVAILVRLTTAIIRFRRIELAIPGPPSLPVLGNALDIAFVARGNMYATIRKFADRFNDLCRFSLLNNLVVLVSSPDLIEKVTKMKETQPKSIFLYKFVAAFADGLVTFGGAKWRAHHKAFLPAFHLRMLHSIQDVLNEECRGYIQRVQPGVEQDVIDNLRRFSAGNFFRSALSLDANDVGEDMESAINTGTKAACSVLTGAVERTFRFYLWPDFIFRFSSFRRDIDNSMREANKVIARVIQKRRGELRKMGALGDNIDSNQRRTLVEILLQISQESGLTDEEITAEIVQFQIAAMDTTTATLSYAMKIISTRQDIQDRLRQEAKDVLGDEKDVSMEHLARLEYTERVLKETLRIQPPLIGTGRTNLADVELGGYTIPAKSTIILDHFGLHRHPQYWKDPLVFDPDRFLPERSVGRHPYAYIPFSVGPRRCIGGQYAMIVMKTFMATLLRHYRIDPVDDGFTDPATYPVEYDIISRFVGGVRVVLKPLTC